MFKDLVKEIINKEAEKIDVSVKDYVVNYLSCSTPFICDIDIFNNEADVILIYDKYKYDINKIINKYKYLQNSLETFGESWDIHDKNIKKYNNRILILFECFYRTAEKIIKE